MAVTSTDLLVIERGGTLYKAPVSELPSGGGGGAAGLTLLQQETITTAVAAVDFDLPAGYSRFKLLGQDLDNVGGIGAMRVSTDGGSSFLDSDYALRSQAYSMYSGGGSTSSSNQSISEVLFSLKADLDVCVSFDVINTALSFATAGTATGQKNTAFHAEYHQGYRSMTSKADVLRILSFFQNYTAGTLSLYGYKESI